MEQKQINFDQLLEFGENGEAEVAKYLMDTCNMMVLPLYQFNGKDSTPLIIHKNNKKFIAPDLTCFANGNMFPIEVKTKNKWVHWDNQLETGFNYEHYKNYKEIQELTQVQWIVIFNQKIEEPTGYFYTKLTVQDKFCRHWDGKVGGNQKEKELWLYNKEILKPITEYFPQEINEIHGTN